MRFLLAKASGFLVVNNNVLLQWGRKSSSTAVSSAINGNSTYNIAFSKKAYITVGSCINAGDIFDVKSTTATSFNYWIADRISGESAYESFYWLGIGY